MPIRTFFGSAAARAALARSAKLGMALHSGLGKRHVVEYAEAVPYIGPGASSGERRIDTDIREHAVPSGK